MTQVGLAALAPERFETVFGEEQTGDLRELIARASKLMKGRAIWNVNSTARGGGVAELLQSLLAYSRGAGIDSRWVVIEGDDDFFRVTKRLHNQLHGFEGDGGALGPEERRQYEATLARNAEELAALIEPEDVVLFHDPQTAGLVEAVRKTGAAVIWRAHIGLDLPNDFARAAWDFLRLYVTGADAYVFSRTAFAWEGLDPGKVTIIAPSIDAFSPKNQVLPPESVRGILHAAGLLSGSGGNALFTRTDGSPGRVHLRALAIEEAPLEPEDRVVVQVSRWDHLKDPVGVMRGFADHVAPRSDAHLALAGPSVESVADDPEGLQVWGEARGAWSELPEDVRRRVHLFSLPMDDPEENAAMVNALQSHAAVVVQKSLAEGFGLTVAEAMWKARPVVASRVGGIQDQVEDGVTGILLDDPGDLRAYGAAVLVLLEDEDRARAMGEAARERVLEKFLGPRHLGEYIELIQRLIEARTRAAPG